MFDRIKQVFQKADDAPPAVGVAPGAVAAWAVSQRLSYAATPGEEGFFGLGGEAVGRPWRLECTAPSREYIRGRELRARADLDVHPDAAVLVLNRPLKEALEARAYALYTDNLQTTVGTSLPEELRWLAMFQEVGWSTAPDAFWRDYAVVADTREQARQWVQPELVDVLAARPDDIHRQTPFMLMLMRGKVYLRTEFSPAGLPALAYATSVLRVACEAALRGPPPAAEAEVDVPL